MTGITHLCKFWYAKLMHNLLYFGCTELKSYHITTILTVRQLYLLTCKHIHMYLFGPKVIYAIQKKKFFCQWTWFNWLGKFLIFKGVLHPWALFLKTLCVFSKNTATSDKVSYGSGQKCSKELKNHSFTSVETIVVKLQWKMCENQYFSCFEP